MAERVIGLIQLKQRLNKMPMVIKFGAARALYQFALEIMAEAKEIVPVDTGALKDSGTVELATVEEKFVKCNLHFGSTEPSSKYAIYVHENLEAHHPSGGQAKFLEKPILRAMPRMAERVAELIDLEKEVVDF